MYYFFVHLFHYFDSLKSSKGRERLEVRKRFFSQKVINVRNKLPDEVMKAVSQQVQKLPWQMFELDMGIKSVSVTQAIKL